MTDTADADEKPELTAEDRSLIRRYLQQLKFQRRPDDLIPRSEQDEE